MFDWMDPIFNRSTNELIPGVEKIPGETSARYVAVSGEWAHKLVSERKVIHTDGLEYLGDLNWELFIAQHQNDSYVWGQFVEGLGLINVMVRRECVRDLTEGEKAIFSGKGMVMVGSHTGTPSYGFNLPAM